MGTRTQPGSTGTGVCLGLLSLGIPAPEQTEVTSQYSVVLQNGRETSYGPQVADAGHRANESFPGLPPQFPSLSTAAII